MTLKKFGLLLFICSFLLIQIASATTTVVFFNTTGTTNWTVPSNVNNINFLSIAGGGSGGNAGSSGAGGGGGAGGVIESNINVYPGEIINITVGLGGIRNSSAGQGRNGSISYIGNLTYNFTSLGGGGGGFGQSVGGSNKNGIAGGSGGGGGWSSGTAGSGLTGQGKGGGTGGSGSSYAGGGGGNSTAGSNGASGHGGNGGNGWASSITGTQKIYAGGAGGSGGLGGTGGIGGSGGGANGTDTSSPNGINGTNNLGGGGSGCANSGTACNTGGYGGNGVVIINYTITSPPNQPITFTVNNTFGLEGTDIFLFNDTSSWISPTIFNWSFGDNTYSNNDNDTHIYGTGGVYSITLNLTNTSFNNQSISTNLITIYNQTTSSFTENSSSGVYNLGVAFNYTGLNTTFWNWSFGDTTWYNTSTASLVNTSHGFTRGGNFTVILYTSDHNYGLSSSSQTIQIFNRTVAGFSANVTSGNTPLSVGFNVTTPNDNATMWNWSPNNGISWFNGTLQNFSYSYPSFGIYTVKEIAQNPYNLTLNTQSNYITVYNTTPTASFTGTPLSGVMPLSVTFTDLSTGNNIQSWNWSYGDGNWFNNTISSNPSHTYQTGGSYSVSLTVKNDGGSNTFTQTNYINVYNSVTSTFNATPLSGVAPLTVQFVDNGSNATSWNWSFGDGQISTIRNASHVYNNYGLYTVNHSANSTQVTSWTNITNMITVNNATPIVSFNSNTTSGIIPLSVQFTDTSIGTNIIGWNWSFGDGNYSNVKNPIYIYNYAGMYNINLTVTNDGGSNSTNKTNYITALAILFPVASYTSNSTPKFIYPDVVKFTDTSTNNPTTWNWSFGDGRWMNGTNASAQNPYYVYPVAGIYNVSLLVNNTYGSSFIGNSTAINLTTDDDVYSHSWLQFNSPLNPGTIYDQDGNAWSEFAGATIVASPLQTGWGNGSLSIQSINSRITSAQSSVWDFGASDFELEFWINPTTVNVPTNLISRTTTLGTGTSSGWGFRNGGTIDSYGFWMGSTANETSLFTIANDQWSHIVIMRNSGIINIYLNGNLITTKSQPGIYDDIGEAIHIGVGNNGGGDNERFYLDEFRQSVGFSRFTSNFITPYQQYKGNLFQSYYDINPNSTLRYKTDPNIGAYIDNVTNGGHRNRTFQIQNITNATSIFGSMTYDKLHEYAYAVRLNSSTYTDLILSSSSIDPTNGSISFNVSRTAGMNSLFNNRTSLIDAEFVYTNYSLPQEGNSTQFFTNGFLIDGQHNVTYPIHNFIATPLIYGDWNFTANFSVDVNKTIIGNPIIFNSSFNGSYPNRWNWTFGDGVIDNGTNSSISHLYSSIGVYTVNLTEYMYDNTSNNNTVSKIGYINITDNPPIANFTTNVTSGVFPLAVLFNDTSIGGNGILWNWSFGDGVYSSSQNTTHVYNSGGNWSVIFTVINTGGVSNITSTIQVNNRTVSGFNLNTTQGTYPLAVSATTTNAIDNASFRNWSFDSGLTWQNGTDQTLGYLYTRGGNFTVIEVASNNFWVNTTSIINAVQIFNQSMDSITSNVSSGNISFAVQFNSILSNTTSVNWSFGDGNFSNALNPVNVYSAQGSYNVILNASNGHGYYNTTNTTIIAYPQVLPVVYSNFTSNVTSGVYPTTIQFTDQSNNTPTSWNWSFGTGAFSNSQNPTYTFGSGGNYTVTLNASNINTSSFHPYSIILQIFNQTQNSFTSNVTSGHVPFAVQFTGVAGNTSPSPAYNWTFGDTGTSTLLSPVHTYSVPGIYNVTFSVNNGWYTNTTTLNNYIIALPQPPISSFTVNNTFGVEPVAISFTDTSTGSPTSWNWSFGDGLYSISQNPVHIYANNGTYTISLNSSNTGGSNISSHTTSIIVYDQTNASFTSNVTSGLAPLSVKFTDLSINATSWNWSFGDGLYSISQNPTDTYTQPGLYNVTLIVNSGIPGSTTVTKTDYINVTAKILSSPTFTSNTTNGTYPLSVNFTDTSGVYQLNYENWSFGTDSWQNFTFSSNPTYIYNTGGNFTVGLYVTNTSGTNSTFISNYIQIFNRSTDSITSNVTSGNISFAVQFTGTTTNTSSVNWSFGDGNYSISSNPVYTYNYAGVYLVILNASNGHGYYNITNTTITAYPQVLPVVYSNFTSNVTSGVYPTTIQFTDQSNNTPTSWNWSFGTGAFSNSQNPTYTFGSGGNYTVTLNASNINTSSFHPYSIILQIFNQTQNSFTSNVTSGYVPLSVQFTGIAFNATNYLWTFGDGGTSTSLSPVYIYNSIGTYEVDFDAYNTHWSNWSNKTAYITVNQIPAPTASFTENTTSGLYPLVIQFTDTSTGSPTSWNWSFGTGAFSNSQNPTYTFGSGGNYTVTLNASNNGGSSKYNTTIEVFNRTVAGFNITNTSGVYPLLVLANVTHVNDNSTYWNWSFGNGVWINGSSQNVSYTYQTGGIYTITEYSNNLYNTSISSINNAVTVYNQTQNSFTSNVTSGYVPLSVQFTGIAFNATNYLWIFDGSNTSSNQNPLFIYTTPGIYNVNFSTSNGHFNNWTNISSYINATLPPAPISNFTQNATMGIQPLAIQFNDTSINNPLYWNWSFGDGGLSNLQNPEHIYVYSGHYNVTLQVCNYGGCGFIEKDNLISVTNNSLSVDFTASPLFQIYPSSSVSFSGSYNTSLLYPDVWSWNFGDGDVSNIGQFVSHTYSNFGKYTIILTGINGSAQDTNTKVDYITIAEPITANFIGNPLNGTIINGTNNQPVPASISFTDLSNNATIWNWSFGDGGISNLKNPTHLYYNVGYYTVSLTVTNIYGITDTKTINNYINITQTGKFNIEVDQGETYLKWKWYSNNNYNMMVDGQYIANTVNKTVISDNKSYKVQTKVKAITNLGYYDMESLEPNSPHTFALIDTSNQTIVAQATATTLPHQSSVQLMIIISWVVAMIAIVALISGYDILAILLVILSVIIAFYGSSISYNSYSMIWLFYATIGGNFVIAGFALLKWWNSSGGYD